MAEVTRLLAAWRHDYNHQRPHSSLGDDTPAEFAAKKLEGTVPSRRLGRSRDEWTNDKEGRLR